MTHCWQPQPEVSLVFRHTHTDGQNGAERETGIYGGGKIPEEHLEFTHATQGNL